VVARQGCRVGNVAGLHQRAQAREDAVDLAVVVDDASGEVFRLDRGVLLDGFLGRILFLECGGSFRQVCQELLRVGLDGRPAVRAAQEHVAARDGHLHGRTHRAER